MRFNKQWACNQIRRRYPEALGIRKHLQRAKVRRFRRNMLPEAVVRLCEEHPSMINPVVASYSHKWRRKLRPVINEMEEVLSKSSVAEEGRAALEDLKSDILFTRMAYGFLPSEYVGFHFENRNASERQEFMSDIDMKIFGYSVNDITEIQKYLDKGDAFENMSEYYKRDAVVVSSPIDYKSYKTFIRKHNRFVKKAVISSMGQGVELVDLKDIHCSELKYFLGLIRRGKYLLEDIVVQDKRIGRINQSSVNTVRCITLKTDSGIIIPYCFFKAGRNGAFVDNAGAGGIVVGIDPVTGICFTDGFTEYGERFIEHPDSGIRFKGFEIPKWSELRTVCIEASSKIQDMEYLSYDLALTDEGWVMIEVNEVGQFIIPQIVTQTGIKKALMDYYEHMKKRI